VLKKIDQFLFQYTSKQPFGFLRIATAFLCLCVFMCINGSIQSLIGLNGLVGREITEATIGSDIMPRISWLINPLLHAGFSDATSITILMWIYFLAIILMMVGLFTRPAVFIVWMIHLMLHQSTVQFSYGMDAFANLLLFYCLIMPTHKYYSFDAILFKNIKKPNPAYESFCVRILQIHLCIAYFFSGFSKLLTPGWVSTDGIWQSLTVPNYKTVDFSFLANYPIVTALLGCSVIVLELFYPIFMYVGKTRKIWLIAILLLHMFIGLFMLLPFFGLVMIIFNIAAFGWNEFYPAKIFATNKQE